MSEDRKNNEDLNTSSPETPQETDPAKIDIAESGKANADELKTDQHLENSELKTSALETPLPEASGTDTSEPDGSAAATAEPEAAEVDKLEPETGKKKSGWLKVLLYTFLVLMLPVVLAAGYAAYDVWNFLNSVPENPGRELSIVIEPGTGFERVTADLYKMGVIKSPWRFKLLVQYKKKSGALKAGEFAVNTGWKPEMVLDNLVNGKPLLYRLTLREGLSWWETAKVVEEAGFAKADDFAQVIRDRRFLDEHNIPFDSAEGFLFPDTYLLQKPRKLGRAEAEAVAGLLVDTFWSKAGPVLLSSAEPDNPIGSITAGKADSENTLTEKTLQDSGNAAPNAGGDVKSGREVNKPENSDSDPAGTGEANPALTPGSGTEPDARSHSDIRLNDGSNAAPDAASSAGSFTGSDPGTDKNATQTQSSGVPEETAQDKAPEQAPALIRLAQASQDKQEKMAQGNATAASPAPSSALPSPSASSGAVTGPESAVDMRQDEEPVASAKLTASPSLMFSNSGKGTGGTAGTGDITPTPQPGEASLSDASSSGTSQNGVSQSGVASGAAAKDKPAAVALPKKLSPAELRRLIILASLVEKETAVPDERARVAGVYSNRLKKKMLLQCDPTIIYGVGPAFKGSITRSQLNDAKNLYNTYKHAGLPPGPICSPGLSAIKAAAAPDTHDYLYFVATGDPDGSHTFSKNLQDHNRAVNVYQKSRR